jgi:hypothetical protein
MCCSSGPLTDRASGEVTVCACRCSVGGGAIATAELLVTAVGAEDETGGGMGAWLGSRVGVPVDATIVGFFQPLQSLALYPVGDAACGNASSPIVARSPGGESGRGGAVRGTTVRLYPRHVTSGEATATVSLSVTVEDIIRAVKERELLPPQAPSTPTPEGWRATSYAEEVREVSLLHHSAQHASDESPGARTLTHKNDEMSGWQ